MNGEGDDGPVPGDARHHSGGAPVRDREMKRAVYIADISARLRYACRHLSDDEFASLVSDMAEMKLRFASIDAAFWPHARS